MNGFVETLVRPTRFQTWTPEHRLTVALTVLLSVASAGGVTLASEATGTTATVSVLLAAAFAPLAWILLVG
ncbi:MAG: hypothetical protein ACOCYZ_06980, partial [Halococcoides sp.]